MTADNTNLPPTSTLDCAVVAFLGTLMEDYSAEDINAAFASVGYLRARQAPAPVEVSRLAEALKFYADGNHRTTLTNTPRRCGFDWDEERQKLNDAGFFMVCENSSGSEDFVEDGTIAAEALAAVSSTPASEPDETPSMALCPACGYMEPSTPASELGPLSLALIDSPEIREFVKGHPEVLSPAGIKHIQGETDAQHFHTKGWNDCLAEISRRIGVAKVTPASEVPARWISPNADTLEDAATVCERPGNHHKGVAAEVRAIAAAIANMAYETNIGESPSGFALVPLDAFNAVVLAATPASPATEGKAVQCAHGARSWQMCSICSRFDAPPVEVFNTKGSK